MRRVTLLLLAFMFTASACFGTSGSWRCANGTPCEFTPGVGFHCPGAKPGSNPSPAVPQKTGGKCSHCRPLAARSKTPEQYRPCGSACSGCRCEFRVISSSVPGMAAQAHGLPASDLLDHPIVLPSVAVPTTGFTTWPILFATGPPNPISSLKRLTMPARAPPRLLPV